MAMKLDKINLRILKALQRDSRISNLRLADEVGLSESACHGRVKKLFKEGYIDNCCANINLSKVRYAHFVVNVGLKSQSANLTEQFRRYIESVPEITLCYKVSGEFDYILHFMCADAAQFNSLSEDLLQRQDIGVDRMSTQLVIDQTKPFTGYPLETLFGEGD